MTPKRSKSTVLILTIVFLLITSLGLCVLFAPSWSINAPKYPGSTDDFRDHADYEINSATIITSLDHGDINVFVPELVTPDVHTGLVSNILWHQSDYLKVVNALHQYVWHETLTDWK